METTRRSLHGVAELLLAGPQFRAGHGIRLRVTPGGFGTTAAPDLRLDGDLLVAGALRIPVAGRRYTDLAAEAGVEAGAPAGLYSGGSGVSPAEEVVLDPEPARLILRAFAEGDEALRAFAPGETPVLWPEHFDVAITVDEVNYGVSPGDAHLPEPYAYVGPHRPRTGPFWTAPFGAARALRELGGTAEIRRFFEEGRAAR
ncbi:hypothetical protein [Amycolatopsis thermophila]|uniref:Uncharacterized protein n=1 Tax=Amycolatopsis thermophila TaxID=206084 RepID=A0ABU0EZ85_9PSEU|nr:hypothetical protein [Amycolatopsis thermophila]MDQ0380626.1 hypothetical protein [Amycolatopsis thermophila]